MPPASRIWLGCHKSDVIDNAREPIGMVLEIAGAGSHIAFDLQRLSECAADAIRRSRYGARLAAR